MMEFLRRFFAPERSSETAKERLRLVLLSDHLSLAPDVVEALKRDLLEVISRYVEIDPTAADVTFEHRDSEIAMLANVPITGVRERVRPAAAPAQANEPEVPIAGEPATLPSDESRGEATVDREPAASATAALAKGADEGLDDASKAPRSRRRRRRAAARAKLATQ